MKILYTLLWSGGYYTMLTLCLLYIVFPVPHSADPACMLISMMAIVPSTIVAFAFPFRKLMKNPENSSEKWSMQMHLLAPFILWCAFILILMVADSSIDTIIGKIAASLLALALFVNTVWILCPELFYKIEKKLNI